jgi:predicted CoA-substrate-specific enzyme activase
MDERRLGIDVGAVAVSGALLVDGDVVWTFYAPHRGEVKDTLEALLHQAPLEGPTRVGLTGDAPSFLREGEEIDGVVAMVEGIRCLYSGRDARRIRHIMGIGGESFVLINLGPDGRYQSHESNTSCASGTGAFLDQQAVRLGLEPPQLGELAAGFEGEAPPVATRCAVFVKTDLIHLQQLGFTTQAIAAGLCRGIAHSICDTLVRGNQLDGPVALAGGVGLNRAVVAEIERILGVPVLVPRHVAVVGAIGAAAAAERPPMSLETLRVALPGRDAHPLRPALLCRHSPDVPDLALEEWVEEQVEVTRYASFQAGEPVEAALGIDIGSTSTKLLVCRPNGELLWGMYTRTQGRPIEAVQRLFATLQHVSDAREIEYHWRGVATTGSGRILIGKLIGADRMVNEITAHARAAVHLHPQVDTLIEIGGQDSKFCRIRDGQVVQSVMNYVCAAGTGSFIEGQAQKLGVPLTEVGALAMGQQGPLIAERCTVFMERDLNRLLAQGWDKAQLMAAVLSSICANYLHNVAGPGQIGRHIVFQGATARNRALVAAFEAMTGKPIHVSPVCHLAGAFGAALLALEAVEQESTFRGLGFAREKVIREQHQCDDCRNHCRITVVRVGEGIYSWGYQCGREPGVELGGRPRKRRGYIARREQTLREVVIEDRAKSSPPPRTTRITVGLIDGVGTGQHLLLWKEFFRELGIQTRVQRNDRTGARRGRTLTLADFCAPITAAHGQVAELLEQGVDYVFLPALWQGSGFAGPPADEEESGARDWVSRLGAQLRERWGEVDWSPPDREWLAGFARKLREKRLLAVPEGESDWFNAYIERLQQAWQSHGRNLNSEWFREQAARLAERWSSTSWSAPDADWLRDMAERLQERWKSRWKAPGDIEFPRRLAGLLRTAAHDRESDERDAGQYYCYYTIHLPAILRNLSSLRAEGRLLDPLLDLTRPESEVAGRLHAAIGGPLRVRLPEVQRAFRVAARRQRQAARAVQELGARIVEEVERSGDIGVVLMGRPYNLFDHGFGRNLVGKFEELGVRAITHDALSVDPGCVEIGREFLRRTHWTFGKQILAATEFVARHSRLFPVYVTNFRCSPDAFVISYFKQIMEAYHKPYLVLQLDELAADVGYVTRIEAALDAFRSWRPASPSAAPPLLAPAGDEHRVLILPHADPLVCRLVSGALRRHGIEAITAKETPKTITDGLEFTGGGECLPLSAILGSVIHTIRSEGLDPSRCSVYTPISMLPCNFPQFPLILDIGLHRAGLEGVHIETDRVPGGRPPYSRVNISMLHCYVLGSIIRQMAAVVRPYEREPGATNAVRDWAVAELAATMEHGEDVKETLARCVEAFAAIPTTERGGRPRIALIGDLYVKSNDVFNQYLEEYIEKLGGEVLITPWSELLQISQINAIDGFRRRGQYHRWMPVEALRRYVVRIEAEYRRITAPVIAQPHAAVDPWILDEVRKFGIHPEVGGETMINVSKVLFYLLKYNPDAIIHINPMFCCPGAVSASILERIQELYGIPVVNIFYDGTGDPNRVLRPHVHYFVRRKRQQAAKGPRPDEELPLQPVSTRR